MSRRAKQLNELVLDGTFEARRPHHRALLFEDDARDPVLRAIQERFRECGNEFEQRAIAKEFEEAVRHGAGAAPPLEKLLEELKKLGPNGSAKQAIGFFPRYLRWDDGTPFALDPFQREVLELALEMDERGRYLYTQVDLWIPRGNGKTPLLSGLGGLATLTSFGRPKILQLAGDGDQAKLGLEYFDTWLEDGELGSYFDSYSGVIRRRDGRGTFFIQKASGTGAHGKRPLKTFVDALWALTTAPQVKTYEGASTAVFKRAHQNGQMFQCSTAGYDKNTIGGRNWDTGMQLPVLIKEGRDGFLTIRANPESRRLFIAYGMPDGYDLDLENDDEVLHAIRLANPASFIDAPSLLEALRRADDVNAWLRFNLNLWTKAKGSWFRTGLWRSLESEFTFDDGDVVWVGVDCSHVHDTTAVAWAKRLENGRIAVEVRVFSPTEGVAAHEFFEEGTVDTRAVEAFILELARDRGLRIAEIAYDPTFFHDAALRLKRRGFKVIEYLPKEAPYKQSIQDFYKLANDGVITHSGDKVFEAHAEAVAAEKQEHHWRLYHLKASEPFDAISAAHLAGQGCAFDRRSVLETDGMLVLEATADAAADRSDNDESETTVERASREQAARMGLVHPDDVDDEDAEGENDDWDIDLEDED